jgi:hypothetical protein
VLKEIRFQNFRVLKSAVLPLSRVTVIAGANGSGKSTVLQSLRLLGGGTTHPRGPQPSLLGGGMFGGGTSDRGIAGNRDEKRPTFDDLITVDRRDSSTISVEYLLDGTQGNRSVVLKWEKPSQAKTRSFELDEGQGPSGFVNQIKVFNLNPAHIAEAVQLQPNIELGETGEGLAGVLDNLDDSSHERFQSLNAELPKWIPEYDRVKFEVTDAGTKAFSLRRRHDGLSIGSKDLSEGTLIALVLLTLAHLPTPPLLVALEHPDASIHPRLLRKVQDAIYRLAYPEDSGDTRPPTQVVVTTHSPYFLDLFKEHPEQIVFANKTDEGVTFQRLSDRPHIGEILPEGPLGDLWYSGLLGGVPSNP